MHRALTTEFMEALTDDAGRLIHFNDFDSNELLNETFLAA